MVKHGKSRDCPLVHSNYYRKLLYLALIDNWLALFNKKNKGAKRAVFKTDLSLLVGKVQESLVD